MKFDEKFTPNMKVKAELSKWIEGDHRIYDRRVVDQFGTEIVILETEPASKTGEARFRVLRGFALGEGAGVSVDVADQPLTTVVTHLLSHYQL
jgi:hypothetical protein